MVELPGNMGVYENKGGGTLIWGVLIIRMLLFRVLTMLGSPIFGNPHIGLSGTYEGFQKLCYPGPDRKGPRPLKDQ